MVNKLIIILLLTIVSCGQGGQTTQGKSGSSPLKTNCSAGQFDPQNIEQLLTMINSLPKPLELECILKSLKRPFGVNATSSKMSVQPAVSSKDPRIFIFKGNLILSFVTAGEGSLILEFSELKNTVRSIKGEIEIPVLSRFKKSDAFSRIETANKTSCSGCHTSEWMEYKIDGVQVYSSKALRPTPSKDVSLERLKGELYLCQSKKDPSRRCAILSALLSHGEVTAKDFPEDMPMLLDSFL